MHRRAEQFHFQIDVMLNKAIPFFLNIGDDADSAPRRENRVMLLFCDFDFGRSTQNGFPKIIRSEEHTSELQSLMRISYAVFCLKKKTTKKKRQHHSQVKHKLLL